MIAFVLSGGGNYGALQAGALAVLLERGTYPDMLVGTSVGALNAAFLAADPTAAGTRLLAQIWSIHAPLVFSRPNNLRMLLRLARGQDSLLPDSPLQHFIRRWLPDNATFGALTHPVLYVTATRLSDGALRVFGDDPNDQLFDALMASTALPPLFRPWTVDGETYIDGGIAADLPLQVAIDRGASEIYALQIAQSPLNDGNHRSEHGMLAVASQAVATLIDQSVETEIAAVQRKNRIRLHRIPLWAWPDPGFWDFSHGSELVAVGRRLTEDALTHNRLAPPWRIHWQEWLSGLRHRVHAVQTREGEPA